MPNHIIGKTGTAFGRLSSRCVTTFAELGLSDDILAAVRDVGYESPSPIQEI